MALTKITEYYDNDSIHEEYSINIKTRLKKGKYKSYWENGNLYEHGFFLNQVNLSIKLNVILMMVH